MPVGVQVPETGAFHGKSTSFWNDTTARTDYPPLDGDLAVDVAIIGAGIAGITAAVLLHRAGCSVALIEARRVAEQVTGRTTAKITSQHNLIYARLIRNYGAQAARLYAESNQAALERIAAFVTECGIDCDFERQPAYLYTTRFERLRDIENEIRAARQVGLPAFFAWDIGLPFRVAGAIRFDDQAQFHPRKYLLGLLRELDGTNARIFEQTRVLDVEEGRPCRVSTERGEVSAQYVIIATNLPVVDPGGFFSRAYPRAHVALAARIDPAIAPAGMFLSIDGPSRSIRTAPAPDGGRVLIAVGESFRPGSVDTEARYRDLEAYVQRHFRVNAIDYRWTNEDYDPVDDLFYIGRMAPLSRAVYVATGFKAWGMTGGTLAAMILSDQILGRHNPWARLYNPNRTQQARRVGRLMRENVNIARKWIAEQVTAGARRRAVDLGRGEAAVLDGADGKVAAYKDRDGTVHAVSAICTHMGCVVGWNAVERTWDCPCHGSRFDDKGEVLDGPATKPLAPVSAP